MIINHKAAIELLVEQAEDIGFNTFTFDPLRLRHREALIAIVAEIVRGQQPPDEASVRRVACRCSPSKTEFPQLNSNP